jgi:hypothetical protein
MNDPTTALMAVADDMISEILKMMSSYPVSTPWLTRYIGTYVKAAVQGNEQQMLLLSTLCATALQHITSDKEH